MLSSSGISNSYLASHVINQIKIHSERARKLELRVLMDARRYIMLILPVLSSPAAHQSAPAQKAGTHGNHNYQLLLNAPDATAGWWYNSPRSVCMSEQRWNTDLSTPAGQQTTYGQDPFCEAGLTDWILPSAENAKSLNLTLTRKYRP